MPPIVIGLGGDPDWKDPLGLINGGGLEPRVHAKPVDAAQKQERQPARLVGRNSSFDTKDWNDIVDTVIAEAAGDGPEGMLAVASTIKNRAAVRGISAAEVVRQPSQFEGYENPREGSRKAQRDPAVRSEAEKILQGVFDGALQDPTDGADHFHADYVSPAWAKSMPATKKIGGHTFYRSTKQATGGEPPARGILVDEEYVAQDPLGLAANDDPFRAVDKDAATHPAAEDEDISTATAFLQTKLRGHGPEHITGMMPEMQTGLTALMQAAPPEIADGLEIFSGTRTVERQKELFDAAVKKYGSVVEARKWVAPPPGEHGSKGSQHNHGRAADLAWNGQRLDKAPAHVRQWVHENAGKFGMAFPLGNEPWHIEPVGARGEAAVAATEKPNESGGIVVDESFQAKDGMGLYREGRPFAQDTVENQTEQQPETSNVPVDAVDPEVTAANERSEKLRTELEAESPGRYTTVDESELENWQQQWETENRSQGRLGDLGRKMEAGNADLGLAVRSAVQSIPAVGPSIVQGLEAIDEWVTGRPTEQRLEEVAERARASVTPEGQASYDKTWWDSERGTLGPAWYDPDSYLGAMAESVPAMAASMGPGALLARGAYATTLAKGIGERAAAAAAARTALLSGAISEGIIGGGQAAREVEERVSQLPREKLLESEAIASLIAEGMSEDEAVSAVTQDAATKAMVVAGVATGAFGGLGDRALAKIIADGVGGGVAKRILDGATRGAVAEGVLEELPQSVAQTAAENYAVRDVDPSQDVTEGLAESAASGLAVGAAMGGALGGAGGAVSPATEPVIDEPVSSPVIEENPPAGARRAGPLARALEHGAAQTAQQPRATIGNKVAAAAAETSGVRPPVESTVQVNDDGNEFMGRIEGYDGDEALVVDSSTGEVFQIPLAQMTVLAGPPDGSPLIKTGDSLPESSSDPAFEPQAPVASQTTTEMPPRSEQQPATERLTGAPEPGQRVIVDTKELGRFAARIGSYEEGATEALVTNDAGESYQVPVDRTFVSNLTEKQVEQQELKRNPPVERETPVLSGTDRRIGDKTVSMPDELHARLYDLGKERLTSKRLLGTGQMDMNDALPSQQRQLAKEFGVDPQALGQLADDYRYRAERAAKGARSKLATKLPPVNEKRLKDWQAEHRRAGAVTEPEPAPDLDKTWWDAMAPDQRRVVLDKAGVKRSEKVDWAGHSANIRAKLAALREPEAPLPIEESVHLAATSPLNDLPEPTQAQKEAGNYKVGRLKLGGLDISIENPAGSERRGTDPSGKPWSVEMKSHYGYIRGTVGKDKDHIDVFVKPGTESVADDAPVFVVDQNNPSTGRLDEHKVLVGFSSEDEARSAYLENYTKDWNGLGTITVTTVPELKAWISDGDTKKRFANRTEKAPDFKALVKNPEFKSAFAFYRERFAFPHHDSPVAHEMAEGWNDGKLDRAPRQPTGKPSRGNDPIDPYMMGYVAAKNGTTPVIRASQAQAVYDELTGVPVSVEPTATEEDKREARRSKEPTEKASRAGIARKLLDGAVDGDTLVVQGEGRDLQSGVRLKLVGIDAEGVVELQSVAPGALPSRFTIKDLLYELKEGAKLKVIQALDDEASIAPAGWAFADTGTDTGLGAAQIEVVNQIIRDVAGLSEVMWTKRIDLPNGAASWGSDTPTTAGGFYSPAKDVIAIAEDSASATTAYHEAFHRLQHLFLTPREKAILRAEIGRLRRIVQTRIGREQQAAKMSGREVEAEAFATYAAGGSAIKPYNVLRAAWDRILRAVRQVQNFLKGRGLETAEDVFDRAKSGEIAKREKSVAVADDREFSVAENDPIGKPVRINQNAIVTEIKGRLTDLTPALLKTIPLNYFTELRPDEMTAVDDYLREKRALDAYRGKKHDEAAKILEEWRKFVRLGLLGKDKSRAAQLADLMHDATLAGIDPTSTDAETTAKPGYGDLRKRYHALPPAGRALFAKVRDAYKAQAEELDRILLENIRKSQQIALEKNNAEYQRKLDDIQRDKSLSAADRKLAEKNLSAKYRTDQTKAQWSMKARLTKMRMAFESNKVPAPYFPLGRFGQYFVSVKDVNGEVISFSKLETQAAQQRLIAEMQKAHPSATIDAGVMSKSSELKDAMDPRLLAEINTILGNAGVDDAVMDMIYNRYLETLPDLSMRKRFIHRKGVAGFHGDAMRVFAHTQFHASHQMAKLRYGIELQELVNKARDQAKQAKDKNWSMTLSNSLAERHQWTMNPTGGKVAQMATSAAFVWFIGLSPASAILNLAQTFLLGVPILGARYGGAIKASSELLRAAKDFVAGKGQAANANISAEEKRAMNAFYESGLIDRTQSHDLAGVGETGVEYSPLRAKVMGVIGWAFHQAEVVNREVTALAAYRLARKAGRDEGQAIDEAHEAVHRTHFDYSNSSRPPIMQNDFAKVALVFKAYQINFLYRIFRDAHQALRGASPQARREARYQLAGAVGMMSLFAGATGTFGFNLAMSVAGLVFGDDDDPTDFADQFEADVIDILGPELGGVVLNGVPGHYLGVDLNRLGMPDIFFRSSNRDLQGKEEFNEFLLGMLGAVVPMMSQTYQGIDLITDGEVARGVEMMAPKAVRDVMKAYRYANEGVTSVRGDEILPADAIDYRDIIAQALGFTPAKVSETWDRNSALKNAERQITEERRSLVNDWAQAFQDKDDDARRKAIAAIREFNAVPMHHSVPITKDTLKQSLVTRARNRAKREDGVLIQNPGLGRALREKLPAKVYQ